MDGPNESNWTVKKTKSGRSAKVDGPEIQKTTVQRDETGRSKGMKLNNLDGLNF